MIPSLIAAVAGYLWRIILGGANRWASWSIRVRWLHWCWDFDTEDGQPVLRRGRVIMPAALLVCVPIWLSPAVWWVKLVLTVCAVAQWVWPGRDFAVWWSLLGAHGIWAVVGVSVLELAFGWRVINLLPLVPPLVAVASYHFGMRAGDDRIGQGSTGAAVFGCLTYAVW